jgi:hypothetical protein
VFCDTGCHLRVRDLHQKRTAATRQEDRLAVHLPED